MNRGGLHRVKRLWRLTDNERVDDLEVQMALVPHKIGHPTGGSSASRGRAR